MPPPAAAAGGRVAAASSPSPSSSARSSLDAAAVESLLASIPREFRQSQDFNPFSHYDDSVDDLAEHQQAVRAAIELIVDVHHKGFNTATAAFTRVLDSFAASQRSVDGLLRDLAESRRLLTSRNEQLTELWSATQTLTAVSLTLERIAFIVGLPQHLQRLTAHGLHLHCVVLINSSLQMLSEDDLREVDGLLELREEIINARNAETEACIAALHAVVYSKQTPSAEQRAAAADRDREASGQQASGGGDSASSASLSASLSFLRASPFSPFHAGSAASAALHGAGDAEEGVAPSASSPSSPRSVSALLAEESSASFLSAPQASSTRLLSLLVAALDELHALPAAKTQLSKRVRAEVTAIIEREKAVCRERMGGLSAAKRRSLSTAPQPQQPSQQQQQPTLASSFSVSPASLQRSPASSSLPFSLLSAPAASSVCPLPRVSLADRELMSMLMSRLFPALLSVLRHHAEAIQLINVRLRAAQEQAAATSATASGKQGRKEAAAGGRQQQRQQPQSESLQPERDDPRWNVAAVWDTIAIELQLALQEMLRSNASHAELKLTSASGPAGSAAAAGVRQGRTTAAGGAAEQQQLTFSFEDSSAPSIARMSRKEDKRSSRDGAAGGGVDALLLQDSASRLRLAPQQRAEQQQAIVSPSPYNILLLYRPLLAFSQQVQQLLNSGPQQPQQQRSGSGSRRGEAAAQQLLGFLQVFIQSSFLPRLQADVNIAMDRLFADDHAFDAAEEPHAQQHRLQLSSSLAASAAAAALRAGSAGAAGRAAVRRGRAARRRS